MTGTETMFLVAFIVILVVCTIGAIVVEFDERVLISAWWEQT